VDKNPVTRLGQKQPTRRKDLGRLRLWPIGWALSACFVAAGIGLAGVTWLALALLHYPKLPRSSTISLHNFVGVLQLVFASVAGAGALVALLMAYRRQRVAEAATAHDRTRVLNERFTAIAGQLGHDQAAVQLAGVHAMAGLADDWEENRQTCIDVLCAYLRMPYEPDPGSDAPAVERLAFRANREVRHTVIRVITAHLQTSTALSWQGLDFDFTGVIFDGGSFSGAVFSGGTITFTGAVFSSGLVSFRLAQFSGALVKYDSAVFSGGTVSFDAASFSGGSVRLDSAVFSGGTVSFNAEFSGGLLSLASAMFMGGIVTFSQARFSGSEINFAFAKFTGGAISFAAAQFSSGTVSFGAAEFTGALVSFGGGVFSGALVSFRGCAFSDGAVSFGAGAFPTGSPGSGARFSAGVVDFSCARFCGGAVSFTGSAFSNGAAGAGAIFSGGVVDFSITTDWSHPPRFDWHDAPPAGVKLPAAHSNQSR
jgi:hypothetical protein